MNENDVRSGEMKIYQWQWGAPLIDLTKRLTIFRQFDKVKYHWQIRDWSSLFEFILALLADFMIFLGK